VYSYSADPCPTWMEVRWQGWGALAQLETIWASRHERVAAATSSSKAAGKQRWGESMIVCRCCLCASVMAAT
jgi:hypothetical protein